MSRLLSPASGVVNLAATARARHPLTQSPRLPRFRARCSKHKSVLAHQDHSESKHTPHGTPKAFHALLTWLVASGVSEAAHAAEAANESQAYVPSPVNVGWEVYVGAVAGVIPFIIGAYQFTARILIQRRCETCGGNGLVQRGNFQRKCPECGGFFPWQGWKQFLTSTAAPGNGGVLRQPRNQDGIIYRVPAKKAQDDAQDK